MLMNKYSHSSPQLLNRSFAPNPHLLGFKKFYLKLAAMDIKKEDNATNNDGIWVSRKVMIGCSMALGFNGQ